MPQEVEEVPWDIDGNVILKLKCEEHFWIDNVPDGCWWKVVQSSRKDLQGERKFATCMGSYICNNPQCPKYTTEKVKNLIDFKCGPKGSYTCKICGYYVAREYCGALKAVEYEESSGYITIYHTGTHKCHIKPHKSNQLKFTCRELLNRDLHKTPRELKYDLIGYYLNEGDIDKAYEVAQKMDDESIIEKLRHLGKSGGRNDSKERQIDSFHHIKELKETTDKRDRFNIYKINCRDINGEPSFVFKTSSKALEIGVKMDQKQSEGERSILSFEHAYMDAMHNRVNGYKTLTLWMYHPGMKRVLNLAIMECERENTEMVSLFLHKFNEALADYKQDPNYTFNPYGIMCDENAANQLAIEKVYGKDFLVRVVTCQWHFKQCAMRQLHDVHVMERETFKEYVNKLCYCYTVADYKRIRAALENLATRNNILNWWQWWDAQKFHIVPTFRGFNISGLNLAETGHSMLKVKGKMWLSVATWRDVCFHIVQANKYTAFVENTGKVTGKGPTLIEGRRKEKQIERDFISSCKEKLEDDFDLEGELEYDGTQEDFFVPNRKAKHRVPKTFSDTNPEQKKINKNKAKKRKRESSDEDSSEDDPEINMGIERVPYEKEQQHMRSNPLLLTPISGRVQICTGCKVLFTDKERKQPHDLVFRIQMRRQYTKDGKKKTALKKSNVFFHMRDLGCVCQISELCHVERNNIYVTNKDFVELTREHIDFLKKCHYWDYIKRNRENVTKD